MEAELVLRVGGDEHLVGNHRNTFGAAMRTLLTVTGMTDNSVDVAPGRQERRRSPRLRFMSPAGPPIVVAMLGVGQGEAGVHLQGLAAGVAAVGLDEHVVNAPGLEPVLDALEEDGTRRPGTLRPQSPG